MPSPGLMWLPNGCAPATRHALDEAKREYEAWETRFIAQLERAYQARMARRRALGLPTDEELEAAL